ncbi:hypothetical protein K1719_002182 [Acacia pycnantha]|nr:hypothetical protein K1719_002182 [Acacia pycnantha]
MTKAIIVIPSFVVVGGATACANKGEAHAAAELGPHFEFEVLMNRETGENMGGSNVLGIYSMMHTTYNIVSCILLYDDVSKS